jgi:hypothetical protein
MPMPTPNVVGVGPIMKGSAIVPIIRRANPVASSSEAIFGNTIAKSSPPTRANTVPQRITAEMRVPTSTKYLISGRMAVCVVDCFEAVEVDHQHGSPSTVRRGLRQNIFKFFREKAPIGQTDECVMAGKLERFDLGGGARLDLLEEICGASALRELLENRLQQFSSFVRIAAIGPDPRRLAELRRAAMSRPSATRASRRPAPGTDTFP